MVVPTARLVDTVPASGVHTYNSYIGVWRAPNTIWCCSSNYWRASVDTSLIISPIWWRSPSVRVIRSNEVFEAFDSFHNPTCSLRHRHFSWVDIICRSMPPCSVSVFGSSKGDFCPSRSSFVVFYFSFANFIASCATWALATASSFLCFSANCAIHSFASSFFRCTADFSTSTAERAGVLHSGSQDSRTMKMKFSVTR